MSLARKVAGAAMKVSYLTPVGRAAAAARVAARIAGAAPYVAAAMKGARKLRKVKSRMQELRNASKKPRKSFTGSSTARYVGKVKLRKKSTVQKWDTYASNGYVSNKELYGKINDGECVHLIQSTYDNVEIPKTIAAAIFRKLFKMAKIVVSSPHSVIEFTKNQTGSGTNTTQPTNNFAYRFQRCVNQNTTEWSTYFVPQGSTLDSMAADTSANTLTAYIQDSMYVDSGTSRGDIGIIQLCYRDGDFQEVLSSINAKEEKLELEISSTMKVQNRTKSVSGSNEDDAVDNIPLQGYVYEFNGGVPLPTEDFDMGLNRIGRNGVKLVRGAEFATTNVVNYRDINLRNPPPPKLFKNCKKATKVILQPGEIKSSKVSFQLKGTLHEMVGYKLLARQSFNPNWVKFCPGKSQMFSLEEIIDTPTTNLIDVQYEIERKTGCQLKTVKRTILTHSFAKEEVNNITPV